MPITPDTKDWTWVLDRPCPECGFVSQDHPREKIGETIRQNGAAWTPILERPDARIRNSDDRWSDLEYGCHVRDVYRIFGERLALMLEQDDPTFQNWDQDQTAVDDDYQSQDPLSVRTQLVAAANALADRFDSVEGDQWERPGTRSNGSRFTVATLGIYGLHDPIHHLWDVSTSR